MSPDIGPAVPKRLHPFRGSGIVASFVPPLILDLVSQPPVQLNYYAVIPVQAVPASPSAAGSRGCRLSARLRKLVRPFHVAVIPELQH